MRVRELSSLLKLLVEAADAFTTSSSGARSIAARSLDEVVACVRLALNSKGEKG